MGYRTLRQAVNALENSGQLIRIDQPIEENLLAGAIQSNIRELEGALVRRISYSSLTNCDINATLVDHVLKDILDPSKDNTNLSVELIKKTTLEYYNVKLDDMSAKIRTKEIATARQVAMYLARKLTGTSLPKIGAEFGGRDHTTVLHAFGKIKTVIKTDPKLDEAVKNISAKLKSYSG